MSRVSQDEASKDAPHAADAVEQARERGPAVEAATTGDAIFDALWKRVEETWDDDKAHHAFLEHAIRTERLPDAAGRYRRVKDGDPARAARAQKKLDGIVIAATHMLMAMKTPAPGTKVPPVITLLAFVISMGLLTWLYFAMTHRPR